MTTEARRDALMPAERAILDAYEIEIRELHAPVRAALATIEPDVAAASDRCSHALEAVAPSGYWSHHGVARTTADQLAAF